jgi:hypothetical protein
MHSTKQEASAGLQKIIDEMSQLGALKKTQHLSFINTTSAEKNQAYLTIVMQP